MSKERREEKRERRREAVEGVGRRGRRRERERKRERERESWRSRSFFVILVKRNENRYIGIFYGINLYFGIVFG